MSSLAWIVLGGLLMSAIAMIGSVTLILKPATLDRLLLPLVAFAAGSLIGGAFFHMIPAGNFLYIGASDLVPEVNKHDNLGANAVHLLAFVLGLALLLFAKMATGS